MQSLRQAFNNAWQAAGPSSVCDMCPLHHLHQLCVQLEGKRGNSKVFYNSLLLLLLLFQALVKGNITQGFC